MTILITGGSGSGKSAYAESKAHALCPGEKIYVAAMLPFDEESRQRIRRHREMRREKNFITAERYTGLKGFELPQGSTVLLECLSNLLANERYMDLGAKENAAQEILLGIDHLRGLCDNVVIVTNEVFSDGAEYPGETAEYIRILGEINRCIAEISDAVVEVVCGLPVVWKGSL